MIQYRMIKQQGAWWISTRDTRLTCAWAPFRAAMSWGDALELLDRLIAEDRDSGVWADAYVQKANKRYMTLTDVRRMSPVDRSFAVGARLLA